MYLYLNKKPHHFYFVNISDTKKHSLPTGLQNPYNKITAKVND